ncbi:MAG: hypothetical protein SFU56_01895 [Capsulimonadales bacterium]|nr:hypothetical protein [Capsulimonadales bacterium]
MAVVPEVLPPPVEPPGLRPEADEVVRGLLGDSYPDELFLIYFPQRVSHAFYREGSEDLPSNNSPSFWVLAFPEAETAERWAAGMAQVRSIGGRWVREPVQVHRHPLAEACEAVKRLYPRALGLLLVRRDGGQIRHWVQ